MQHSLRGLGFLSCALLLGTAASDVAAQVTEEEIAEVFREAADVGQLGAAFQALNVFVAAPGAAAAHYTLDGSGEEATIRSIAVHPNWVSDDGGAWRRFTEIDTGFAWSEREFALPGSNGELNRGQLRTQTFSAIGGGGAEWQMAPTLTVRMGALAGISNVTDDADIDGPDSQLILDAGQDILFDISSTAGLYGGLLAVRHQKVHDNGVVSKARLRLTALRSDVFAASDDVLKQDSDLIVSTLVGELNGPTPWFLFNQPLRWNAFASSTSFGQDTNAALGFGHLMRAGGGLSWVAPSVLTVKTINFKASLLGGDDVSGYQVGFSVSF
ncbi:MAG: hypothetical protein AAF830_10585 [Pseudomonadota bacterium]